MRTLVMALLAGLLSVGGAGLVRADEDEAGHKHESVTMADIPAPAQKTLKREAKGGKLEELRRETQKDGTIVYEAEIVRNGKGTDIEVSADGKVIEREKPHDEASEPEHQK